MMKRTYCGNANTPERVSDCVAPIGMWMEQCSRKRGYGADNLYCKQHAKINEGVR